MLRILIQISIVCRKFSAPMFQKHSPMVVRQRSVSQHYDQIFFSLEDKLKVVPRQRNPTDTTINSPGCWHIVNHPRHRLTIRIKEPSQNTELIIRNNAESWLFGQSERGFLLNRHGFYGFVEHIGHISGCKQKNRG